MTDVRPIRYHPTDRVIDVGRDVSPADYELLASLSGRIGRDDNVLECLSPGGDPWLYVYHHSTGMYYARHFPGGAHPGPGHRITPKSPEHLRAQEYGERGFALPAAQEVTTNNRTRLDVATLDAPVMTALEVQFTHAKIPEVKARTTRSMRATAFTGRYARPLTNGVLPIWLADNADGPPWRYQVPTIETSAPWHVLPPRNTVVAVGVRRIVAEKCTPGSRWQDCPVTGRGSCRQNHPYAELLTGVILDEFLEKSANGLYVPIRYFTGSIFMVEAASVGLYTELGGDGAYSASEPAKARSKLLGPCRSDRHGELGRGCCAYPGCTGPKSRFGIYAYCDGHVEWLWQQDGASAMRQEREDHVKFIREQGRDRQRALDAEPGDPWLQFLTEDSRLCQRPGCRSGPRQLPGRTMDPSGLCYVCRPRGAS
jgi:prepilin-type processing-associated H-X9-DG protein